MRQLPPFWTNNPTLEQYPESVEETSFGPVDVQPIFIAFVSTIISAVLRRGWRAMRWPANLSLQLAAWEPVIFVT